MTRRLLKSATAMLLSATMVLSAVLFGTTAPAFAHDPIFLSADQTTPDTGPYMPDGTISWALYGSVLSDGDTRGFEFDVRDGDEVFVSLLIPNLSPEVDLTDDELPIIELEDPSGDLVTIVPEIRVVFDEPFSNTSYVTLAEYRVPAEAGRYRGIVVGGAASRFSVAIGETEIFFTETERGGDRPTNFAEITVPLTAWYTTPAGGEQDLSQLAEGEAEIDLDMINEAMETGEAEAPEGSTDEPAAATDDAMEDETAMEEDDDAASISATAVPETATAGSDASGSDASGSDTSESASAPLDADGSSSTTWVAPVVIGAIAVLGGGAFLARRKK